MKKRKTAQSLGKRILLITGISVMLLLVISAVFNLSFYKIHNLLLEKDMEQVEFTSNYVIKLVYTEIEKFISAFEVSQNRILDYKEGEIRELTEELEEIKEEMQFEKVGVVDLKGNSIDDTGKTESIQNPEFMEEIKNNRRYISNVVAISDALFMAVPIVQENEVKGAVWGYCFVSMLAEEIELSKDSHLYFQIVDDTGTYISNSNNIHAFARSMNLWDELKKYQISDGITVEDIKNDVEHGRSGYFNFVYKGQGRHVVYEPLGIKNWYVFSMMVEEYLGDYIKEIEKTFSGLLIIVLGAVTLVTGLLGFFIYKTMRLIKGQNEQLLAKNRLLFMVLEHTNDIPFEIDLLKKEITFYRDKDPEKVMIRNLEEYAPENMIRKEKIISEEYETYRKFYQNILSGTATENLVLKIKTGVQWEYRKIHIEVISQEHMIGFLEDCTEQIIQNQRIKEISIKVQNDSLTGLYSRDYFVQEAEKIMQKSLTEKTGKYCALFLLDLDYFKKANDTLGHMTGDRILAETGKKLKAVLRKSDLIGRLGGDEFVVFIENAEDISAVKKCAEKINETLCATYGKEKKVTISASVGVAVWTGEKNFAELYKIADTALYRVKERGRDGYYILCGNTEQ